METKHPFRFSNLLYAPFGCLLEFPLLFLGGLVVVLIGLVFTYYWVNVDLWGFGWPDYQNIQFDSQAAWVRSPEGMDWKVTYESPIESQYNGLVRFVSPIRSELTPILTHDILVTSGDFANESVVSTSVFDHRFYWSSDQKAAPTGRINLLHTVPRNEGIYKQLLDIRSGQMITLRGLEIFRIETIQKDGKPVGKWEDTGCNSLLVNFVQIQK